MSTDEEAQQDEMLAMESIFDADTFQLHPGEIRSGQIKIRLDLPDQFVLTVDTEGNPNEPDAIVIPGITNGSDTKYKVDYLPPLTLHFTLPKSYPSQSKPNFTLSSLWLHRASLTVLCQKLDDLWEENKGMGILFTWANYLQVNTLTDLGIPDFYDVSWLQRPFNLSKKNIFLNPSKRRGSVGDNGAVANGSIRVDESTTDTEDAVNGDDPPMPGPSGSPSAARTSAISTAVQQAAEEANPNIARQPHKNKRKRKTKTKPKKKTAIDQRAANDPIPRKEDGKDGTLLDYLLLYNEQQVKETFSTSSHSCDICFSIKIGHKCVRFRCGHVFCEECVTGFFITNIVEGNVDQVKCLAFNCKIKPTPELVKMLVGETHYERYDQILLKRALENMSDVTYCPRPKCHNPVICDPNDKCASCTVCAYTFCRTCKMVYHGVEPCRFKDADMKEVFKKYTEGTPLERKAMLKTYGEKQLKVLVENVLSEQWIQKESKQCPHCKVPIEKFEGCNKVTCFKCNTYFCWLCLKQLEHGNPYFHFNDPSSKCYNNLFQDVDDDDDDDLFGDDGEWLMMDDTESDTSDDDEDFGDIDFDDDDDDYYVAIDDDDDE